MKAGKACADYALVIRRSYVCDMLRGGAVLGRVGEWREIVGRMGK